VSVSVGGCRYGTSAVCVCVGTGLQRCVCVGAGLYQWESENV